MYHQEKHEVKMCNSCKEQLTRVTLVIHTVHDGHQLLQSCHWLLFISFTHKICTKAWNHPLNASQGGKRKGRQWGNVKTCLYHVTRLRHVQVSTIICPNGPIFMMFWNCSYMSLRVNWPVGKLVVRGDIIQVWMTSRDASYHASACQSALRCHLVSDR